MTETGLNGTHPTLPMNHCIKTNIAAWAQIERVHARQTFRL